MPSLMEAPGIQISVVHGPFEERESLLARARMFKYLVAQHATCDQSIGRLQGHVPELERCLVCGGAESRKLQVKRTWHSAEFARFFYFCQNAKFSLCVLSPFPILKKHIHTHAPFWICYLFPFLRVFLIYSHLN